MNNISLVGRAGRDPDKRFTQNNNTPVTTVSIAVNRPTKDKTADWFTVEAWGKLADTLEKYVKKGDRFGVSGRVEIHNWTSDNGKQGTTVKVVASNINLLANKNDNEGEHGDQAATADEAQEMFS